MHPPITVISERNHLFRQRVEVDGLESLYGDVLLSLVARAVPLILTTILILPWAPAKRSPYRCMPSAKSGR